MYLGCICELAPKGKVFDEARHPYTQALLSAIPVLGQPRSRHLRLTGEVPTPIDLPQGCVFHRRCEQAFARCRQEVPQLIERGEGHLVACHAVEEGRI